jgi:hypothetical protein
MTAFHSLLTSLPTGNSTLRMRVWRALKNTGCAVLRDGVYILPASAPQVPALAEAEAAVRAAGGFAMTAELNVTAPAQVAHVLKLFDRGREYGVLVERIGAAKLALKRLGKRRADTLVERLRRSLGELAEIDFFPGQAHMQAKAALSTLEQGARALHSPGEPRAVRGRARRLEAAKFRNRTWTTRQDLWVDRLACVWLIRRFIDSNAKFVWFDRPADRPRNAIGFDYDGARFTHVESCVTYEVLLASFGLDEDRALAALGDAVHFLDVGGIPVTDAGGLETILRGIKSRTRGDDETALEAGKVFDHFYAAYAQKHAVAAE